MGVFVYRVPCFFGTSGSLSMLLFQACIGGVSSCLSLQPVSVERWASCEDLPCRFQKVDLDRQ
jgi:hypothetical protein